jgi:hypothetical protein
LIASGHALRCIGALVVFAWIAGLAGCSPSGDDSAPSSDVSERRVQAAPDPFTPTAGLAVGEGGFAEPGACASCHPRQHAAWVGSHHDRAMELPSEDTVLGDFENAAFTQFGVTTHFRKRDGKFVIETEGEDGAVHEFVVAYTFGFDPLQQYLVEFPKGRLQSATVAWDTSARKWFSLYPDERIPPDDPLHWTGRLQRWNTMCAECHSTALDRAYDVDSATYDTSWAELDVGCQACHGPGSSHVAWARSGAEPEKSLQPGEDRRARTRLAVGFSADAPTRELDVCGPCHSRRHRVSDEVAIGEPYADHFALQRLRPDLYHVDGQVLGEVYVQGSFVQSLMHQRGVRCTDCHDPHTLQLRAVGEDEEQAVAELTTLVHDRFGEEN